MEKHKSSNVNEEIKALNSMSDDALKDSISALRSSTNIQILPILLKRWNKSNSDTLTQALFSLFLETKSQHALIHFMDAIFDDEFKERQDELISILWQSALDASDYFKELVELALQGEYMTIIEVSTVIDSFDHAFYEDQIVDALYTINEAIDQEEDEERFKLLSNLSQIVSELYTD